MKKILSLFMFVMCIAVSANAQSGVAVASAISGQTKETWTFTLANDSTVTKTVVLG